MQMTDAEFRRIVLYMKSHFGIELEKKKEIVSGRLDFFLTEHNYHSYGEFMDAVECDVTKEAAHNLVDILTTNHTYFMREFDQFEFFRDSVLPEIKKKKSTTHDLRIWSAAASSGEEAYTLAMIIRDTLGIEYSSWDSSILATDISIKVLQKAVQGIYTAEQIDAMPLKWKQNYFQKISDHEFQITEELRRHVLFRKFNLMNPFPFRKNMDVVFLRNVMIYFNEETKRNLIRKVYDILEPGGYLFIGTTECIERTDVGLEYVKPSIYRKQVNGKAVI